MLPAMVMEEYQESSGLGCSLYQTLNSPLSSLTLRLSRASQDMGRGPFVRQRLDDKLCDAEHTLGVSRFSHYFRERL